MSENSQALLDVYFCGDREYIQGSQIISKSRDWLLSRGLSPQALTSAEFREIIAEKCVVSCNDSALPIKASAQLKFIDSKSNPINVFVFKSCTGEAPFRQAEEQKQPYDFTLNTQGEELPYRASTQFVYDGCFGSLMKTCVEFSKVLHLAAFPGCQDVWFSGIRNGNIPTDLPNDPTPRTISIDVQYVRSFGRQSLSTSLMNCDLGRGNEIEFQIIYAFKLRSTC